MNLLYNFRIKFTSLLALTIIAVFGVVAQNAKIQVPLRFDFYYTYDEMNKALEALHKAYPKLTKFESVGKSEEGRDIYVLTINNPSTGSELQKPGIYVDGNIHGNEIQAGEVCLYYANLLLTKYGENERITHLLDKNVHYIVPVVNVDGRDRFMTEANTPSTNRTIRLPKDDDRDGLFDEDGYEDIDGDGNICQMRIRDPFGMYRSDPEDPRLMIRVKPGEQGEWTLLGYEGIDNDGDGRINEDPEGYVDPNRNWGFRWYPRYVERGAGYFPFSGVGLKALAEWMMTKPNIIMVFAFHNMGGMWLRGPATQDESLDPKDVALYDYLGENAEKMTPGYRYMPSWQLYPTFGDFGEFTYNLLGAYSFIGELFMSSQETYRKDITKPLENPNETSRERLKFNDHLGLGEMYKPWTPFKHPHLGDIEIGGWVKMTSRLPQPFMLPELVHRNAAVIMFAAEQTPEIKLEVFDVKEIGRNLHRVRVRLSNSKGMPSMTAHAVNTKLYARDKLKVSGQKVVAGGRITNLLFDKVTYKEHRPEIQFLTVPGFGKEEFEFLVEGKGNLEIEYSSQKAGIIKQQIRL